MSNIIVPQFGNSTDERSLPERIATLYQFKLAFQDVDGVRYYFVQDWILGVVNPRDVTRFWQSMKRRNPQLYTRCIQLQAVLRNGKPYQMDHADAESLYLITQRMEANSGNRDAVLEYLAKAGVVLDEMVRDPDTAEALFADLADEKEYRKLLGENFSPQEARQWVAVRRQQKETQKRLQASWNGRGAKKGDKFGFGRLNNDVQHTATGTTATKASRQLNIKGTSRDYLSAADNAAIEIVCSTSRVLHEQLDSEGVDQLSQDIQSVKPVIDAARPELEKLFSQQPRRLPPSKPNAGA